MLIDSGCNSNIINTKIWSLMKKRGVKVLSESKEVKKVFKAFGCKEPLRTLGTFEAYLVANNKEIKARFFVLDVEDHCLLGNYTAKALDILKINVSRS